jgi:DNA-directed RNA polymerase subunit RPC12/RpoP
MANIIGQGEIPQMPGGQPKVDISQSLPMVCENCGYDKFISTVKVRRLSKLSYGGAQDMVIPFDLFICGSCGEEFEALKPLELRALEAKDKLSSQPKIDLDTNG